MRRKEIISSKAISFLRQRRERDACSSCETPSSIRWRAKLFLITTARGFSQHLHLTDENTESQRGYDLSLVKRSLSPFLMNQVAKDQKESWTHSVKVSSCGVSKAGLWSPPQLGHFPDVWRGQVAQPLIFSFVIWIKTVFPSQNGCT